MILLATSWVTPSEVSLAETEAEASTEVVPSSTGLPARCSESSSSSAAAALARAVL